MPEVVKLHSGSPIEKRHHYSRLVMADNWIFMALCAGVDPKTNALPDDPIDQARQAIANIRHSLEKVGSGLHDIVRFVSHIPNRELIYPIQDYVGSVFEGIEPVMSLYCGQLGADRFACEFEVTAYKGAGSVVPTRIDSNLFNSEPIKTT